MCPECCAEIFQLTSKEYIVYPPCTNAKHDCSWKQMQLHWDITQKKMDFGSYGVYPLEQIDIENESARILRIRPDLGECENCRQKRLTASTATNFPASSIQKNAFDILMKKNKP